MKFLFVGSKANLDLTKIGGIESAMRELFLFLKKRNHTVQILLIDSRIKEETKLRTDYGDIPIIISNISSIRKKLFSDYDVINFLQTPFANPIFAIYFFVYKIFSKSITTKFFFTYPTLKNTTFLQKLKLKLLIDNTYVFSKRLEPLAKKIVNNVSLLYPPVSDHFFKDSLKVKGQKKKILFVGRLSKDKGLEIVIDVFKHLPKEEFHTEIMGYFVKDSDRQNFEVKLHNLKLDKLTIIEQIAKNKALLPLNEYDMLLLPYQDLGPTLDTPLLILEGLVSGCKIITSNIEPINFIEGNIFFADNYLDFSSFVKVINDVSDKENVKNRIDYSTNNFGNLYLKSLKKMGLNV